MGTIRINEPKGTDIAFVVRLGDEKNGLMIVDATPLCKYNEKPLIYLHLWTIKL